MLSRRSTEIDRVLFANAGEDVFYGGEQSMFISIVMRLYPLTLQDSPKRFRDVEMRGVRREIEYMETPFLPSLKTVLYLTAFVNCGVIQNDHCLFADAEREILHKFDEPVGVYVLLGGETMIYAVAVYHSEDIESSAFVNGDAVILVLEFPCIRHISFGAYVAFITVIKVNEPGFPLKIGRAHV